MEQVNYKKFYPTAIALYFTYFIHGIGAMYKICKV